MNLRGYLGIAIIVLTVMGAMIVKARAHGWYDADCCSGQDCEPVQSVTFVASDPTSLPVMVVTTSLGTKPLTNQTKIRESKDSRLHACIYGGVLLCIYLPPGN